MMVVTSSKLTCPINGNVTIRFETDAEDRYFDDHLGLGEVEFSHDIVQRSKLRIGLYTLTIKPSLGIDDLQVGQKINFNLTIKEKEEEKFSFQIPIEITDPLLEPEKPEEPKEPKVPNHKRPNRPYTRTEKADPNSKQKQSFVDRPDFTPISKEDNLTKWEELFEGNENKAAVVKFDSDGRPRNILINISHPRLLLYRERNPDITIKRLISRYINFIGFYTWSLFLSVDSKKVEYPEKYDPKDLMEATADALAFFGLGYLDAAKRI